MAGKGSGSFTNHGRTGIAQCAHKGKLIPNSWDHQFPVVTDVWPNSNHSLQYIVEHRYDQTRKKQKVIGGGSSMVLIFRNTTGEVICRKQAGGIQENNPIKPGEEFCFCQRDGEKIKVLELVAEDATAGTISFPKLVLLGPLEEDLDPRNTVTKSGSQ